MIFNQQCRCYTVSGEISNGGLNQFYFNNMKPLAEMSIEGFSALGSQKLSDVMAKAVELYQDYKQVLDGYNDGTVESFSASYARENF
ncbi:MAG: DMP19 family protein [Planctomycetaceae bacterium]|nr:DMP19 family protein [Planctomycetaceae bacterium]